MNIIHVNAIQKEKLGGETVELSRKAEKSYLIRRLSGVAPYDFPYRKKILKSMSLKQLRVVNKIAENITYQNTSNTECKQCRKLNVAMMMYEGFRWKFSEDNQLPWPLGFDEDTETILVSEEMLMYFVQLANPGQPIHRIRLISHPERQSI